MKYENRSGEFLKTLFVIIGVIASISALALVAYSLFKKYFQVTFDCGDEGERFDADDDDYFADEDDEPFEPILCCDEEEATDEEEPAENVGE
ncbi:MAG: hypothetical protein II889_10130 [Clostridia bacterium]|nr:hypothetical protein [Clostridia bacterium]MCR4906832.1 hypothetical protein [Clostridiales bacterium]